MSVGRNDPCPCGSGRKYKRCCMAADQAAPRSVAPFGENEDPRLSEKLREVAEREPVWQAEAMPVMLEIEEPGATRPIAVLVTAGDIILEMEALGTLGGGGGPAAEAIEAAVSAAARRVGVWPHAVQVRHIEVAEPLRQRLAGRDVAVAVVNPMPPFEEIARSFFEELEGGMIWPPACRPAVWSAWDLPRRKVGELFDAAAAFWRAAPWKSVENLQAPRAVLPSGRTWTACILGNAGEEFGIALYSDRDDLFERQIAAPDEDPFAGLRGRILSLSYAPRSDVSSVARQEAKLAGWETAGRDAFPMLATVNMPGGGVTEDDAGDLVLLLLALPAFVEQHRLAFSRELNTGEPCEPIDWMHEKTGVRLSYAGEAVLAEMEMESTSPLGDVHDEMRAMLREAIREVGDLEGDDDEILDAVNERVARRVAAYNDAPQDDFGGLSPQQVFKLLRPGDWINSHDAIKLHTDIGIAELSDAVLFHNIRTVLRRALELDGLPATDAGNLKMSVVADLMGRLQIDPEIIDEIHKSSKRILESSVYDLFLARVIAEVSGLLVREGGRFHLVDRDLLDDARAGDLFARLFEGCFRRLDLSWPSFIEWPGLQYQVPFTLARLEEVAGDWATPEDILEDAVLPRARDDAPLPEFPEVAVAALESHVLRRLVDFGLLEGRERTLVRAVTAGAYRVTPLYERFLSFEY